VRVDEHIELRWENMLAGIRQQPAWLRRGPRELWIDASIRRLARGRGSREGAGAVPTGRSPRATAPSTPSFRTAPRPGDAWPRFV